ncbi:hypothetical protein R1sor_025006 [Riccia sorocarpa]|uniref:SET domain-containing protein n=1 Tax=Riccia sorocarpa TaxID=122646 RepID=A0ABD3G7C5_9MARC
MSAVFSSPKPGVCNLRVQNNRQQVSAHLQRSTTASCSCQNSVSSFNRSHRLGHNYHNSSLGGNSKIRKGCSGGWEAPKPVRKRASICMAAEVDRAVAATEFAGWLKEQGFPEQVLEIKMFEKEGLGCAATRPLKAGDIALTVPENFCVTAFDVNNHPVVSAPARGRGDLIGLTLWLMYERTQGESSAWYPFLKLFPEATSSPLLWSEAERDEQLKGSPALEEVKDRVAALEEVFEELDSGYFQKDPQTFGSEGFSLTAFKNAFSTILSRATYLPTADIFALVPYGDCLNHKAECEASLDFSTEEEAVVLRVDRDYRVGEQVFVSYGADRSNSDLLISYGFVDQSNPNDYLSIEVELLPTDRLMGFKQQILEQAGFDSPQTFPLFKDRFPTQLLTYMRLSRLSDVGLFAKIVFDQDVVVDQSNEYEILMLLMGECRVALQAYSGGSDEESRIINDKKASINEKLAAQLRLCEKQILISSMAALRNRLAPIRGIPVKGGGLKDPNSDIMEMFDMAEQIASAPSKFLSNIFKK